MCAQQRPGRLNYELVRVGVNNAGFKSALQMLYEEGNELNRSVGPQGHTAFETLHGNKAF